MKTALKGVVHKMGLSEFIAKNLLCEAVRKKQGFDTFHPSQSITFLEKDTDNIVCVCVCGDGSIKSRLVEYNQEALAELPAMDRVVPLVEWWMADKGMKGIHIWFEQLCQEKGWDRKSLIVRPHLKAKVLLSEDEIWNKYLERLQESGEEPKKKQLVKRTDPEQPKKKAKKRCKKLDGVGII
jgi:hypothetical protein